MIRYLSVAATILLTSAMSIADEKPSGSGDKSLPDGAVARFGTLRWRHGHEVYFVAFADSGKQVLTSCGDGVVYVWDAATGDELRRFGEAMKDESAGPWPPDVGVEA